jgi:hypothetical protein
VERVVVAMVKLLQVVLRVQLAQVAVAAVEFITNWVVTVAQVS